MSSKFYEGKWLELWFGFVNQLVLIMGSMS
jgi:hypothetical protein